MSRQPAVTVLEVVTERIEPEEKVCSHCGKTKCEIGCEKSERFEYIPAKIIRHEIIRPKLACACKQGGVSIAPLPPQVIGQGQAGASLVAQVILSQYPDHLALYRRQQQFERLGVNFPKSTLGDWVEKGALWLQPMVREIKRELLARKFHTFSTLAGAFSLTPCFSWVWQRYAVDNRFNGLLHTLETVETVATGSVPFFTQLKQGVNESICIRRSRICEISGLVFETHLRKPAYSHSILPGGLLAKPHSGKPTPCQRRGTPGRSDSFAKACSNT